MTKYSPPSQFPSYAKAPSAKSPWDESMASRASNENRPADLPLERLSNYESMLKLKTAKALGLQVLQTVLLRAGRVIG